MQKLFDLIPHEVSLVGKGAIRRKFLITKSGENMKPEELNLDEQTMGRLETVIKSLKTLVTKMVPAKDEQPQSQPLSERAGAALKAVARILAPHKNEINQEHVNSVMKEIGCQAAAPQQKSAFQKEDDIKDEHHSAAMEEADKAYKGHLAKMGYQKYPSPDAKANLNKNDNGETAEPEEEEVSTEKVNKSGDVQDLSAFDEKQKAILEPIFKAHKDLVEKNSKLEKELQSERDERVKRELVEKASKEYKNIGKTEELVAVMKSLTEKDPEALKSLEAVLKSIDGQLAQSALFKEIGSRQSGSASSDAQTKIDAAVEALVQKSSNMSKAQAYDDFLQTEEGRRLYKEAQAARPGGV